MKNGKDLKDMFYKVKKNEGGEYPNELFKSRRGSFLRQIFVNRNFWLIVFFLIMIILCILLALKG